MFYYDLYYDGGFLRNEGGFSTREEAEEAAKESIEERMEMWRSDGAWRATDSKDLFAYEVDETEGASYMFELYYEGCYLSDGFGFESYDEAKEAGKKEAYSLLDTWKKNGTWKEENDDISYFEVWVEEEW